MSSHHSNFIMSFIVYGWCHCFFITLQGHRHIVICLICDLRPAFPPSNRNALDNTHCWSNSLVCQTQVQRMSPSFHCSLHWCMNTKHWWHWLHLLSKVISFWILYIFLIYHIESTIGHTESWCSGHIIIHVNCFIYLYSEFIRFIATWWCKSLLSIMHAYMKMTCSLVKERTFV